MFRTARRELRGGRQSLRVFVLCLSLGVAALAGVGSVLEAIRNGLAGSGQIALGGDAELRLVHRFASDAEQQYLQSLGTVSTAVTFRSMVAPAQDPENLRTLSQVKAVDAAYPLYGALQTDPPLSPERALGRGADGRFGLVAAPELVARLDLAPGDPVQLGSTSLEFRATLVAEPDRISGGLQFGPRVLVALDALAGSGLLAPGSLHYPHYRLRLDAGADLSALRLATTERFPDAGWRWRDRRASAPAARRFIERLGSFLSLVGLAALAVGGIGAGAAIRSWFQQKAATIAVQRSFGASRADIVAIQLVQTLAIATVGIVIGAALGGLLPLLLGPLLSRVLPVPADFGIYLAPLARAAAAGYLTALFFSLLPLAHACEVPASSLFRDEAAPVHRRPGAPWLVALAASGAALAALAFTFGAPVELAAGFLGGFALSLGVLSLTGAAATRWARSTGTRAIGPPALRRALTHIGGAGGDARAICVSLGAGMAILSTIALTDHSLRSAIVALADEETPTFFVLDIPSGDTDAFHAAAAGAGASRVVVAPMLRGFLTALDGVPAAQASIRPDGAWMLRGDRGITYANAPPENARILAGDWWPEDYAGPPLVSFAAEEAGELNLGIGSTITVNLLGRPLTATIANLREVTWERLSMNFLMVFNPGALEGAPHASLATVYLPPGQGAAFLRAITRCCPAATAVSVRDALAQARETLGQVAAAALLGSLITLLTGFAVLAGTAAAGQRRQIRDGAILKALGATRREILAMIAVKWALLGAVAGTAALLLGTLGAWAVLRFVMDANLVFSGPVALATVAFGVLASVAAGAGFAGRALRVSPAILFRARG